MAVLIGRPINGISINGLEYVLDENGEPIKFETDEQARQFLKEHGIGKRKIEKCGILFVDAKEEL